jgi:transcriptional regulator with XRE-family HTH domain
MREERGLSQEKLATKAGVHRTYISMIERCQKNVTVSCLEKIAFALNIEIVDLLHE